MRELIHGSKVVLATLHGSGGFQLRDEGFDVVVVDEVSTAPCFLLFQRLCSFGQRADDYRLVRRLKLSVGYRCGRRRR